MSPWWSYPSSTSGLGYASSEGESAQTRNNLPCLHTQSMGVDVDKTKHLPSSTAEYASMDV